MAENYAFAVARVRALEAALFSDATIDQLLGCREYGAMLQMLTEKGWGDGTEADAETILAREREKTWEVLTDLVKDPVVFELLSYSKLFHNLKAAIKEVVIGKVQAHIYYDDCPIGGEEMVKIVSEKNFSALPKPMQEAAEEAHESFLHTGDGQLCDIIVDRAALCAIYEAGQRSKIDLLMEYAETTVAVADIKVAVRSQKTGKSAEFMRRALAPCKSLNVEMLIHGALSGQEALASYLEETDYREGAEALRTSPSAFERWCDNRIIEAIKPQKYKAFTVGPVVAYVLARENEIKTVRIILSGRQNGLSDDSIREKVREMYV